MMVSANSCNQIQGKKSLHLVIFPLPFQGHLNPMLALATLLNSKGFTITIIHTHFHSPNPSNFPNFHFESIPDGLSDDQVLNDDPLALAYILNNTCQGPFRDCLSRIASDSKYGPVTCIITDIAFYFTQTIADGLNLPRIVLHTSNASCLTVSASLKHLRENGLISIAGSQPDALIPEIPPLRIKDLPDYSKTDPEIMARFSANAGAATRAAVGLIMNTLECLEQTALVEIRTVIHHPTPIFPLGPLHKFSPGSSNSLVTEDHSCLAWLDQQAPRSVIYVSFGSLCSMNKTELAKVAWGLANSNQPFLWVVRQGSIDGHDWVELPDGFEEKTRERGQILKWAPQREVLAHPSVGGFWTHNGWNSTLESICEGVPMLCSPFLWVQKVNARYVSHAWRVGVQLENGFETGEIERAIRRLMVKNEGVEMRKRISDLKESAMSCIRKGGSSYESLESLIDLIMSF